EIVRRWLGSRCSAAHGHHVRRCGGLINRDSTYDWRWARRSIDDLLPQIANHDIERAPSQKIGCGVVVACTRKLPVGRTPREIREGQPGEQHDKREHNYECCAGVRHSPVATSLGDVIS